MNLPALNLPDEDRELAAWLEQQIVGLELGALVAQLSMGAGEHQQSVDEVLGDGVTEVVRNGLEKIPTEAVRSLLKNPTALLELQERVFLEGGTHWDTVPRSAQHLDEANRVARASIAQQITPRSTSSGSRTWLGLGLAIAASIALCFGFWPQQPTKPKGWGFNRLDVVAAEMSAGEYFGVLATAAEEWKAKRPSNQEQLLTRLVAFRKGCDRLIVAEHLPLVSEDRAWLVASCRNWRDQLENSIQELEEGSAVAVILQDTDQLVERMAEALRSRGEA